MDVVGLQLPAFFTIGFVVKGSQELQFQTGCSLLTLPLDKLGLHTNRRKGTHILESVLKYDGSDLVPEKGRNILFLLYVLHHRCLSTPVQLLQLFKTTQDFPSDG